MKFTLSWLKSFLDTTATLDEIAAKLTDLGLEVEGIHDPTEMLNGFVVGHVIECEKHPDADKLKCLIVDTGTEKLKVVCGAPNARQGLKGVFAPAGSYIPGSDITLKKSMIRGAESNGMMCSKRELLLSDEHEGIIELADNCVTGSPAAEALGQNDPVIEIKLTPNRGDCAGVMGIARDLSSAGLGKFKSPDTTPVKGTFKSPVTMTISETSACPLFMGRYIRGVKNGPSPAWLQERLKSVGLHPISALVDITNYMCIGMNRPLHVFDAKKLQGNITVRFARSGEKLDALNDKSYDLNDGMIAICDDSGVLGLGGIVGGTASSCTTDTIDIFVECALFDPTRIARTGRGLSITSDARYRFERSVDPSFASAGMEIATKTILDLCGGEASDVVTAGSAPVTRRVIEFIPTYTEKLGGIYIAPGHQRRILEDLGFEVDSENATWHVIPPSFRPDIDGMADLVEEILRVNGYNAIEPKPLTRPADARRLVLDDAMKRKRAVRVTLTGRGLYEAITWSFIDNRTSDLFGANDRQNKKTLTLISPISSELDQMRPSILPNLIEAAQKNADRGQMDASLFEIGSVFHSTERAGQILTAAGLRSGSAVARHWGGTARKADAYDAKADALAVIATVGINPDSVQISTDVPQWYHPGRSGVLKLGTVVIAHFGEIHPDTLAKMKADAPMCGFEVFLDNLPPQKKKTATAKKLLTLNPLQPVRRDFAFIVDHACAADKIVRAVKSVDKTLITDVGVFDVYAGKGVEEGKKSVAIAVTVEPREKTMTDTEIEALCTKVTDAVTKATGGVLRS